MTYKVAVAISGAVSLGSYEAGTIYELISAIKKHNESNPKDEHIFIDVLTGASAGGMTAALIAQKLLYEADGLNEPYQNAGYQAWVRMVDISGLLDPHEGDNPNTSILSTGFVKSIADNLILNRYQTGSALSQKQHPACNGEIKLGLAMSNLNGVDYARDIFTATHAGLGDGKFVETRYQDRVTDSLDSTSDSKNVWARLANAARCCGAFPFAFSPITMIRKWAESDYEGRGAEDFSNDKNKGKFSFTDGGLFNNYPLGMARSLAKTIDQDYLDYSKRFYFYISPREKASTKDVDFDADSPSLKIQDVGKKITQVVFHQSQFQEWFLTDGYNKMIELLDARAKELALYVESASEDTIEQLFDTAKAMCEALFKYEASDEPKGDELTNIETLDHALERLSIQYDEDKPSNAAESKRLQAWLYSIALLEKAAELGDRDLMRVYTITASEEELAGEKMFSFLGFMEEKFRRYDYDLGRLKAREVINHILSKNQGQVSSGVHIPLNIERLDTAELEKEIKAKNYGNAGFNQVDRSKRVDFYKRVKVRYNQYSKEIGLLKNGVVRWLVFVFLIRKKLRKFLKLA